MNTAEYINWIINRTGRQSTVEETRVLVNSAQNVIFSKNTYLSKKKPQSSCILPTTTGVFQYNSTDVAAFNDPLIRTIDKIYTIDMWGNRTDVAIQSDNALKAGNDAIIYFKEDPGTTTEDYYYDAYTWPMEGQVTSTSVDLSVPEDVQTNLLFFLVNTMLEIGKDGRSIFNTEEEKRYWKDYSTFANQGADFDPECINTGGV